MNMLSSILVLSTLAASVANTYFVVQSFPNSASCEGNFTLTAISLDVCIPTDVSTYISSVILSPFVILTVNTSAANATQLLLSGFAHPNCKTLNATANVTLATQCNSRSPSSIQYLSKSVPSIPQSYFSQEFYPVSVNACSENPDILVLKPLGVCIDSMELASNGTTLTATKFEFDNCTGSPTLNNTDALLPCTAEITDDDGFFNFFTTSSVTLPTESSSSPSSLSSLGVGAAAFGIVCGLVLLMVMMFTIWYNWIHLKTLVCGIDTSKEDRQSVVTTTPSKQTYTRLSNTKETCSSCNFLFLAEAFAAIVYISSNLYPEILSQNSYSFCLSTSRRKRSRHLSLPPQ